MKFLNFNLTSEGKPKKKEKKKNRRRLEYIKEVTANKQVIKKTLKFDPTKCNVFFLSLYLFIFP